MAPKDLRTQFARIEGDLQQKRRAWSAGAPQVVSQEQLRQVLLRVAGQYWGSSSPPEFRRSAYRPYLSLLKTLKMIADDVFIEEFARLAAIPLRERISLEQERHRVYIDLLQTWIRSSPNIDRRYAGESLILPEPRRLTPDYWRAAWYPGEWYRPSKVIGDLTLRATAALNREVSAAKAKAQRDRSTFKFVPSESTIHLFGLAYIILQWQLVGETEVIPPASSDLNSWYRAATAEIEWLRVRILGPLTKLEWTALSAGDSREADVFRHADAEFRAQLGRIYSIRSREAAALWTYPRRGRRGDLERRIIDPKGTIEVVTSLPGLPDPDNENTGGAQDVADLLDNRTALEGTEVKVYGMKKPGRPMRFALYSVRSRGRIDVDASTQRPRSGAYASYVVVQGTLTSASGRPVILASEVDEFGVMYRAQVGSPLRLPLLPAWRTTTRALESAARDERDAESFPTTLAGQDELATEFLRHPEVRQRLGPAIDKQGSIDLSLRATRIRAWRIMLERYQRTSRDPLTDLFHMLQRYLTHFTRHSFWNIRDTGRNYLDSVWPRDLSGKVLHDCGVYALEMAYDLFLTVSSVSGSPPIAFRLAATPDHLTLVGYVGNRSFVINNARIDLPTPLPPRKADLTPEYGALLQAVGKGYRRVHNLQFNVVPFMFSRSLSTNLTDAAFRRSLWSMYTALVPWSPIDGDLYYAAMQSFNLRSRELDSAVASLRERGHLDKPGHPDMIQASMTAAELFRLAEAMVNRSASYLALRPPVGTPAVSLNEAPPLPMYVLANALRMAQVRGASLNETQRLLADGAAGRRHEKRLLSLWQGQN